MRRLVMTLLLLAVALGIGATGASAGFAGKNGRIFFASNLTPTGYFTDIFSMRPNGTDLDPVRMLHGPQSHPTVSPNGRWVAFRSEPDFDDIGTEGDFAMTIRGRKLRPIAEAPTFRRGGVEVWPSVNPGSSRRNPIFSSDGSRMAWQQDDGTEEDPDLNIHVAHSDGSGERVVAGRSRDEFGVDLRPDGRRLVYTASTESSGDDLLDVRFNGKGTRRLTHGERSQFSPDYSPDGHRIVFMANHGENPDMYVMRANGAAERPLTDRFGYMATPDWGRRP